MKKAFIALAGVLLLASCTKTNQDLIIGEWHASSIKVNSMEIINMEPNTTNVHIVFNDNNTGSSSSDGGNSTFTYAISETTLSIFDNDTMVFDIDELTSSLLRISVIDGDTIQATYDKH